MSDAAKNNKLNNQYRSANLSLDYFDRKGV